MLAATEAGAHIVVSERVPCMYFFVEQMRALLEIQPQQTDSTSLPWLQGGLRGSRGASWQPPTVSLFGQSERWCCRHSGGEMAARCRSSATPCHVFAPFASRYPPYPSSLAGHQFLGTTHARRWGLRNEAQRENGPPTDRAFLAVPWCVKQSRKLDVHDLLTFCLWHKVATLGGACPIVEVAVGDAGH